MSFPATGLVFFWSGILCVRCRFDFCFCVSVFCLFVALQPATPGPGTTASYRRVPYPLHVCWLFRALDFCSAEAIGPLGRLPKRGTRNFILSRFFVSSVVFSISEKGVFVRLLVFVCSMLVCLPVVDESTGRCVIRCCL